MKHILNPKNGVIYEGNNLYDDLTEYCSITLCLSLKSGRTIRRKVRSPARLFKGCVKTGTKIGLLCSDFSILTGLFDGIEGNSTTGYFICIKSEDRKIAEVAIPSKELRGYMII